MYKVSLYSGKWQTLNGDFVSTDTNTPQGKEIDGWLKSGNWPEEVDFFEGEEEEKTQKESLKSETENYVKRSKDGCLAYAEISAEFRLAKLNGVLSEETHSVIEKTLIPVRNEVLAGQWISAKNELILLGSSVIGQQLYDRLLNQITNYISENY